MTQEKGTPAPPHFLFVAGPLRERSARASAETQLGHGIWGLRTALIRENLGRFLSAQAHGLLYIVKEGIRVEFEITSGVLPFEGLDDLLREELRAEARYGFIRVRPILLWESSPYQSLMLLQRVLDVPDRNELARRLNLGMHGLTQCQYEDLRQRLGPGVPPGAS